MVAEYWWLTLEGLSKPLLGRPAIQSLQLVRRVSTVNKKLSPQEQYPNLFTGRGELEGDYTIREAKPLALSAPCSKAELLRREVKEELNKTEKLGVIKREKEPTDWCTGNVAVPKQNLMKLNESIRIERYQPWKWVQCEKCSLWLHCICARVSPTIAAEANFQFYCSDCI